MLAGPARTGVPPRRRPALAEAGLLRLVLVRHAGRIVSAPLGFADTCAGYSYAIGSDFGIARQSFGTIAFAHPIEGTAADGALYFDFLRGKEPYKYGWGAEPTYTVRRTIRRVDRPRCGAAQPPPSPTVLSSTLGVTRWTSMAATRPRPGRYRSPDGSRC